MIGSLDFEDVSVRGRIAYGIMCAENYLIAKYPKKNWIMVFEIFWKVTLVERLEFVDDWVDEVCDILPECLFEFPNYEMSDFEILTKDKYNDFKMLYSGVGEDVNTILKFVFDLANSHAYSRVIGKGKESLSVLQKIIDFMYEYNVSLPDVKEVKKFSIAENDGFGYPFDVMSKKELNEKLQHSYEQSLRKEGRPLDEVFDEIE